MKKLLLFCGIILLSSKAYNQDLILKTNGDEIKSKVIEVTQDVIKYKKYENLDGPVYSLSKTSIFMIKYENGSKDVFNQQSDLPRRSSSKSEKTVKNTDSEPVKKKESSFFKYHQNRYFSIATGLGDSYGGLGMRAQARFGGNVGFGVQAGVGWFPGVEDESCFAVEAGFKFYLYRGIYINTQFGILGKQTTYDYSYGSYSGYNYNSASEVLYGPSILTGVDLIFGRHFGFNAAAGISVIVNGSMDGDVLPALDLGFIYKF
jgi:hypothetical protein